MAKDGWGIPVSGPIHYTGLMMKRILATLTVAALSIFGFAVPAQASTYHSCGDGWICFYNWESADTGGGVWGMRIYADGVHNWAYGFCQTMPTTGTSFPGGTAYNKATSIVVNNTPNPNALSFDVRFYDGNNCGDPWPLTFSNVPLGVLAINRLADYANTNNGQITNWNDAIGSFLITG